MGYAGGNVRCLPVNGMLLCIVVICGCCGRQRHIMLDQL